MLPACRWLVVSAGLPVDPKAPLFAFIGRLEEQKGVDILLAAIPKIIAKAPNAQVGGAAALGPQHPRQQRTRSLACGLGCAVLGHG